MLFDVHNVEAQKLKHWDENKNRTVSYGKTNKKKPGPKMRLGLAGKQLGDIFSISETQVSRIVTT